MAAAARTKTRTETHDFRIDRAASLRGQSPQSIKPMLITRDINRC